MELVQRKRIEVVAEASLLRRIRARVDALGVTGYTILPVMGGRGDAGEWSREGQVSSVNEMAMLVCLTTADRAEAVIKALLPMLSRGRGILNVGDVSVARGEKF